MISVSGTVYGMRTLTKCQLCTENTWNAWDIQYDVLLPDGTYGKYDSLDEDIIFFHLEQMADLGIDFCDYGPDESH